MQCFFLIWKRLNHLCSPQGDRFYLLIILPDDYDGVNDVANSLTGSEISNLIRNLNTSGVSTDVQLFLPKFKLNTKLELVNTLKEVLRV